MERSVNLSAREIFRLSGPVMISFVAHNLIGVVDTAFLGRLGEVQLGGASMASLVYFCIYTIGFGLASGTQIIIGHRYGAGKKETIGHVLGQSLILLCGIGILMTLLGFPFGRWLFANLLSSQAVASSATMYWEYRSLGFVFAFASSTFRSFFVGTSDTKVLTYNSIVMSIVNITLDYGLIFGNLGLPALGVKGAAIASVFAEVSGILFYILYMGRKVDLRLYGIDRISLFTWDTGLIKTLIQLSGYLVLQALLSQSVWTVFFFMIESLGERELAVASIVRSFYVLLFIPINSYSTAVRSTVSHIFGAGQSEKIHSYLRTALKISCLTMLGILLVVNTFPSFFLNIFTNRADLIQACIPSLRVISLALIISSAGAMYFSAVGSTGATKVVFLIELFSIVFYISLAAVMVYLFQAPVHLCFSVEVWYYALIALLSIRFVQKEHWTKYTIHTVE